MVFYNLGDGPVAVFFGLEDETMALFGFALDFFVEVRRADAETLVLDSRSAVIRVV